MSRSINTQRGVISIRAGIPADAPRYRELRLGALIDSPTAFSADYQTNLIHPMSFWEGRLTHDGFGVIFLAENGNTLIGMTGVRMGEAPKTKHGAYVWGVYVHPEWRGLRIAEALIEACTDWARQHGVVILKLGVMANNKSAIRCYERCGFKIYGTEPQALYHEDTYYDEYLMCRSLHE